MNKQEQEAADSLLAALKVANEKEVVQYATAYSVLTQGACNRNHADEMKGNNEKN